MLKPPLPVVYARVHLAISVADVQVKVKFNSTFDIQQFNFPCVEDGIIDSGGRTSV